MTYAIFRAAGFQYRAELGDILRLPSMDAESGTTVTFDEVLMGATDDEVLIGQPLVDGAAVRAKVVNHGRADKIVVFKFKRRKNYRRKAGHRQDFTEVRVSEIDLGEHGVVRLEVEKTTKRPARKKPAKKESAEAKAAEAPAEKKPARRRKPAEKKAPEAKAKAASKSEAKTPKKPAAKKSTKKKESTSKRKKKSD